MEPGSLAHEGSYFFPPGGALPRPPPDGLPVVLGQLPPPPLPPPPLPPPPPLLPPLPPFPPPPLPIVTSLRARNIWSAEEAYHGGLARRKGEGDAGRSGQPFVPVHNPASPRPPWSPGSRGPERVVPAWSRSGCLRTFDTVTATCRFLFCQYVRSPAAPSGSARRRPEPSRLARRRSQPKWSLGRSQETPRGQSRTDGRWCVCASEEEHP